MKKFLSILLSLVLLNTTMTATTLAYENTNEVYSQISETFGITSEELALLDPQIIQSLYNDILTGDLVATQETYIKITTNEAGQISMEESSYLDYMAETHGRITNPDSSSGWMRFDTSVISYDSKSGSAYCHFTWLTPPSFRMTDIVGVSLRQGTLDYNTAYGYYSHHSPNDDYIYNFKASDISETGAGATATFKLRYSDYTYEASDAAFLSLRFTKDGPSEGVNGSYAHQGVAFSFSPSFSIDQFGDISASSGVNISPFFTQAKGYVSIRW